EEGPVTVRQRLVVRRGNEALRRILQVRHVLKRDRLFFPAGAFVPTGQGQRSPTFLAPRRLPDQLPGDVARLVRLNEVERQRPPLGQVVPCFVEAPRSVDAQQSLNWQWVEPNPAH